MQKKSVSLFSKFGGKTAPLKIITPILLVVLLSGALITPLYALTPARDLTGTWKNAIAEKYYIMDSFDPTLRMNDVQVTYSMIITQSGSSLSIVLNIDELSSVTDPAYLNEYGYGGVTVVGFNQMGFTGTVSGASFSADEIGASTGNQEHIAGTFTTDIITATLTGPSATTDVNGLIVLRGGSSATMPPFVTAAPTPTPTPAPAPPTSTHLAGVSNVQGSVWIVGSHEAVSTQSQIGAGTEVQTGSNSMVGFNYPDNGGTIFVGANSDAGWVYLQPQAADPISGKVSYIAVPPASGSYSFSEGIEPDEFGQAGLSLAAEVGVGLAIMAVTGAPITLGGALVVEGTLLLGSGIAYVHEQMSPQQGTYNVRLIQVPQGLVMGSGTDYVVTVSNGATTIQVMDGSVIFVDQYTNNSVTVTANQVLTLPSGPQTGFSQQDLQSRVSAFDSSTINQWWTQVSVTPTAAPTSTSAPTSTTNPDKTNSNLLSSPVFLGGLLFVIIVVAAALLITIRGRKHSKQPSAAKQKKSKQNTAQPPTDTAGIFCPSCGNQLLSTDGLCPFCNADLSQWYPKAKK